MKKEEKKTLAAAEIYKREFQLLENFKEIETNHSISKDKLQKEYIELNKEYEALLKKTIKITGIGDANQRKLFLANEQIEKQREELRIAYKKMEILARIDPLTQLSNRRDFLEKFQNEKSRFHRNKKPFAVVLGDIDDFKSVNDQYGHDCGDFVLVSLSKLMKSMIRKQDAIGRWGGEEFIMLLPESPLEGGQRAAEGIRKKIAAEPFVYNGNQLFVTITFGVSEFNDTMDIDTCIKKADEALYVGKRKGKNCVVSSKPEKMKKKGIDI
jgi:diguanylate cyclase (GGDEF)-like protein